MSGNKSRLFIAAVFILTLEACFIFKPKTGPVRPVIDPVDSTAIGVLIDTVDVLIDTLTFPTNIITKDKYHLSILLPFKVDHNFILDFDHNHRSIHYKPLMATEFYEGILLALNDLNNKHINLDVSVFDTENDEEILKEILKKPTLRKTDFIIGPMFGNLLQLVSDFGNKNKIPVISPYDIPVEKEASNPYLIISTPSTESHIKTLAKFMAEKYSGNKTIVLRQDTIAEAKWSEIFIKSYNKNLAFSGEVDPVTEILIASGSKFNESYLSEFDSTVIFIPSFDDAFVGRMTTQLNALATKRGIIVCGMPGWFEKLNSISLEYLNNLQFHFTSSRWIDKESSKTKLVIEKYTQNYGMTPSIHVLKGYNLASYFIQMITNYGVTFTEFLPYQGDDQMNFQPIMSSKDIEQKDKILFYENTRVHVYRYKDYKQHRVSK